MGDERTELLGRVEALFEEQRFGVLCTRRKSGAPYRSRGTHVTRALDPLAPPIQWTQSVCLGYVPRRTCEFPINHGISACLYRFCLYSYQHRERT